MLAVYFLLGGNKVFHFCRAVTAGIVVFLAGIMVCSARMTLIVVVCRIMVFRGQAHHRPMVMVRHSAKRHQQESGNRYSQYGEFTFQC
jgi:hypothetical protein